MPKNICPICHKEFTYESIEKAPDFPFCSERCRLIDLGKWIDGEYVIPGAEEEDGSDEEEQEPEE